jgi:hypothetical protein
MATTSLAGLLMKGEGRSVHGDHRFVFDGFYIGNGETPHELVTDETCKMIGGGMQSSQNRVFYFSFKGRSLCHAVRGIL